MTLGLLGRAYGTTSAAATAIGVQPAPVVEPRKRKKKKKEVVKNTPQEHEILDMVKGNPDEPESNREFRRVFMEWFSGGVFSVETP